MRAAVAVAVAVVVLALASKQALTDAVHNKGGDAEAQARQRA
jgi:hypothetical protein